MSLNDILELCEKHMTEGDYLKAAEILRDVHKDKPQVNISIRNINIELRHSCDCYDADDCGHCHCDSQVRSDTCWCEKILIKQEIISHHLLQSHIRCNINGADSDVDIPLGKFNTTLKLFLSFHSWRDIELKCEFMKVCISTESYFRHLRRMRDLTMDDDDDFDWDLTKIHNTYLDYVIDKTREFMF
jgi:hypothetical protein